MTFDATNLDPTGSGSKGSGKIATYNSADALATIETDGYFDSYATAFTTGDTMIVYSSAATGGGGKIYTLTITTGDVALSTGVAIA